MASQTITITQKQIDELSEVIAKRGLQAQGGEFCNVWPTARTALTALQGIIGAIPGISILASAAIAIVIAAGDAAQKAICK